MNATAGSKQTTPAHAAGRMAVRGTHENVLHIVSEEFPQRGVEVLDLGAGQGGLSRRLRDAGFCVSACDLDPRAFEVAGIECRGVDAGGGLPYAAASFDLVLAVELVEHIEEHSALFGEISRVLRPGGRLLFTTPNILSLKSRMRFLLSGYFYSFGTLDPAVLDPASQHITPFTLDRYLWRLGQSGLSVSRLTTDKLQTSSLLLGFLLPLIRLWARASQGASPSVSMQNSSAALFGRKLVVLARKSEI
ncbi:MAG: class I SAM-dependent methyltransferase [Gammaproteobacteria bacterium]|nr:class I SAM-dependent methyltransferase [Gammaproteobacteria bacterium]